MRGAGVVPSRWSAPAVRVAGIDVSSKSIDVVTIPIEDRGLARDLGYHRIELAGQDAIERASLAADWIPRGTFWDEISRVHIERPFAGIAGGAHAVLVAHLVIGAIIAALPERLRPPFLIQPRSWRKRGLELPVDASKAAVRARVIELHPGIRRDLEQDAYDAVGIARSARAAWLEETAKQRQETMT